MDTLTYVVDAALQLEAAARRLRRLAKQTDHATACAKLASEARSLIDAATARVASLPTRAEDWR